MSTLPRGLLAADLVRPLWGRTVPSVALVRRRADAMVDERVRRLRRVAGWRDADADAPLGPSLVHVLAFPDVQAVLADPSLPFRAVGALHASLSWAGSGRIEPGDRVELVTWLAALDPRHGGCYATVATRARAGGGDMTVLSQFFARRSARADPTWWSRPADVAGLALPPPAVDMRDGTLARDGAGRPALEPGSVARADIDLADGREWASESGDANPIHTSRGLARAFGYRRPIAHGALLLAWLEGCAARLGEDLASGSVRLRAPVLVPAHLELRRVARAPRGYLVVAPAGSDRDLVQARLGSAPPPPSGPRAPRLELPRVGGRESASAAIRAAIDAAQRASGAGPVAGPARSAHRLGRPSWRRGYRRVARALAAAEGAGDGLAAAEAGLRAFGACVRWSDGSPLYALRARARADPRCRPAGVDVPRERPRRTGLDLAGSLGERSGEALDERLDRWRRTGAMTPGAARALGQVARHPEWLALPGWTVAVLGAGAELSPARDLVRWGARVAAVARPTSPGLARLRSAAREGGGELLLCPPPADVVSAAQGVVDWLARLPGRIVLVDALYAPGAEFVRAQAAADAIRSALLRDRPDTALGLIGTPTDVWRVGGRLVDAIVVEQGPNYLGAKRIGRWRATVAAARGTVVSAVVLPASATASVRANPAFARALRGARELGIGPFDPDVAAAIGAGLLVHDLESPEGPGEPWVGEAVAGGLWRHRPTRARLALAWALGAVRR